MRPRHLAMVAVTGAVALAATGCGGNSSASPSTGAPPAGKATPTAAPSQPPRFAKMQFSSHTFACKPKAAAQVKGSWETKAPRYRVKPGSRVKLGLSNSGGAKTPALAVVYTQGGGRAYAKAKQKGSWSNVVFPKDFVSAKSKKKIKTYRTGIFTVVWVTAQGHKFISCDGFATVGAKEPKKAKKPSGNKNKKQHSATSSPSGPQQS